MGGISNAREKHALIIANEAYLYGSELTNPVRDSEAVGRVLKNSGFKVRIKRNLDFTQMRKTISEFGLEQSETDNVAIVYYSGHGAEFNGQNYLIPVDARFEDARKARQEALTLSDVQNFLYREVTDEERASGKNAKGLNIIILDACRNNPYPARAKSASRGLGKEEGASGTMIWYAAQPGARADDGDETGLSPFANAFVEAVDNSVGETVEATFKKVASLTLKATEGRQEPWQAGNILGRFGFRSLVGNNQGQSLLTKFNPEQLDQFVEPFAPENPTRVSIRKFGNWNHGYYAENGKEDGSKGDWGFDAAEFYKSLSNKGPLFGSYGDAINPEYWQELPNGFIATFFTSIRGPDDFDIRLMVFSGNITKVFENEPRDSLGRLAVTIKGSDGSIIANGKPFRIMTIVCWPARCAGIKNYETAGTRPAEFSEADMSALRQGDHLSVEFTNSGDLGVRKGRETFNISLAGMVEAIEHDLEEFRRKQEREKSQTRLGPTVGIIGGMILDSGLSDEIGQHLGGMDVGARKLGISANPGSPEEAYFAAYYLTSSEFIDAFGEKEAEKFARFFGSLEQAYLNPDLCATPSCLGNEVVSFAHWAKAFRKRVPVTPASSAAHKVAIRFYRMYYAAKSFPTPDELSFSRDPEGYFKKKFSRFGDITLSGRTFVNSLKKYVDFHPDGNGFVGYHQFKSWLDGLIIDDADTLNKLTAYADTLRALEYSRLHDGAWTICLDKEEEAVASPVQCFREFVEMFPASSHAEEAGQHIKRLALLKGCATAADTWKFLSLSDEVSILQSFAAQYPSCPQAGEARDKIKTLSRD
tara:strand:- start:15355 stop:17802 length:2448 start_codon:yes stop_codon:yes gene_type:complete